MNIDTEILLVILALVAVVALCALGFALLAIRRLAEQKIELQSHVITQNNEFALIRNRVASIEKRFKKRDVSNKGQQRVRAAINKAPVAEEGSDTKPSYDEVTDELRRLSEPESDADRSLVEAEAKLMALMREKRRQNGL